MNDSLIASLGFVKFAHEQRHTSVAIQRHLANLKTAKMESLVGLVDAIYGEYRVIMQDVQVGA